MHIAIVTAGGAGMFCGSCMHDNTLAQALQQAGDEISLIPTYTPIRVDERNISQQRVFYGGLNVYFEHKLKFWRRIPRWMTRWLDSPGLISFATKFSISNDARELGELTLEMLAGEQGPQRREARELVDYLSATLNPDAILFSNALLSGCLPLLRRHYRGRLFCLLQGDDIFLDGLIEPYREQVLDLLRKRVLEFDGILVHSAYYRDYMSSYLGLPREKFSLVPLGINVESHGGVSPPGEAERWTAGYFARICPEKGLHQLVEAVRRLKGEFPQIRLKAGGYLGSRDADYFREVKLAARDLGDSFEYVGSPPDHEGKVAFFRSLGVLSVPTTYREPKGLYVLEAFANGIPVVQPRHGAFPELLEATGGGLLFEPGNPADHARALRELLIDPEKRNRLGELGRTRVRELYNERVMAHRTRAVLAGEATAGL